jgi:excinuclease UvrABC nuclease subunit
LKLCQAIRDEAHRFAQHYHHILRRKAVLGEDSSRGIPPVNPPSSDPEKKPDA